MEQFDNEKMQRVWARVNAGQEHMADFRKEPNMEDLAQQFRQAAHNAHILSRRLRGRQNAALVRMSRQAWENYRILQQMLGKI